MVLHYINRLDIWMKIAIAISILCWILLWSCLDDDKAKEETAESITEIGIDFVWNIADLNRSPEVHLKNVPEGVDRIEINFFCDLLHEPHIERGGGSLPYDGSGIIPAGKINPFSTPMSFMGTILKMRAIVKAFDKDGQLVGNGTITKKPPNQ